MEAGSEKGCTRVPNRTHRVTMSCLHYSRFGRPQLDNRYAAYIIRKQVRSCESSIISREYDLHGPDFAPLSEGSIY